MRLRQGTIVDATLIAAPPLTKNRTKSRDPDMKQTKKGNQSHGSPHFQPPVLSAFGGGLALLLCVKVFAEMDFSGLLMIGSIDSLGLSRSIGIEHAQRQEAILSADP